MKNIFRFLLLNVLFLSVLPSFGQYSIVKNMPGGSDSHATHGELVFFESYLYGMSENGGIHGTGTIFRVLPDGTDYANLLDFEGVSTGSYPNGSLITDGAYLYGMTEHGGGTSDDGCVFKVQPGGGLNYDNLMNFTGTANGANPVGNLYLDGTYLYGMATVGGTNNRGTLFKIKPDGTGYLKLLNFSSSTGSYPNGAVISDGTFLYGMTTTGGTNDKGTIFKIKPDGTGFVKMMNFSGVSNGDHPEGDLAYDGTFLYGMAKDGGVNDMGTIFKIKTDGTGFTKLHDFSGTTDGSTPRGSLFCFGDWLYGTTYWGGSGSKGTLFKIKTDGSGFVKLHDFLGYPTDGEGPSGNLITDGIYLYGMTAWGGSIDAGTIFKYQHSSIGIEENDLNTELTIHPNPTTDFVYISCTEELIDARVEVVDMLGKTLLCFQEINLPAGEKYSMDFSSLTAGNYIIKMNNWEKIVIKN